MTSSPFSNRDADYERRLQRAYAVNRSLSEKLLYLHSRRSELEVALKDRTGTCSALCCLIM